jgi:hypothetical protein
MGILEGGKVKGKVKMVWHVFHMNMGTLPSLIWTVNLELIMKKCNKMTL